MYTLVPSAPYVDLLTFACAIPFASHAEQAMNHPRDVLQNDANAEFCESLFKFVNITGWSQIYNLTYKSFSIEEADNNQEAREKCTQGLLK